MIERTCQNPECGKKFFAYPSAVKRGGGNYCSQPCFIACASRMKIGDKNPNWKGGKKKVKCPTCKEFFEMDAAKLSKDLWDVNNGITLCVSCHKKEHKHAIQTSARGD